MLPCRSAAPSALYRWGAARSKLARHGTRARPRDILQHECHPYRLLSGKLSPWEFLRPRQELALARARLDHVRR